MTMRSAAAFISCLATGFSAGPRSCPPAFPGVALALLTVSCIAPALQPDPHYVLGPPYQAGTTWYYPRESFDLDETGLAAILPDNSVRLTSDGELFDQTALAGAHPTLQLPAIANLTNLENGREVMIRLNDRGSGDPRRLVQITRRTAQLLGVSPSGVAQVRLSVLPSESHAAADDLPGAPSLGMTAVPRTEVEVAELAPPPGVRQGSGRALPVAQVASRVDAPMAAPPLRLPEAVIQTLPRPGRLMVNLDTFDEYQYADVQRARMAPAGARIVSVFQGRSHHFRVEVGPLPDVAHADAVLEQARASGVLDAKIVVD